MDDAWWPDLLKHIPEEDPWAEPIVTVAEIRSFEKPARGKRESWTALITPDDLERLGGKLSALNDHVETSGTRPSPNSLAPYQPKFWIGAYLDDQCLKFEPLVLSWKAHNHTTMVLDPGFTMTYGLIPRAHADGSIHWDDPAAPEYDIAEVDPPAHYDCPNYTTARVRVSRDHLQDYLTLTGRTLVQIYFEQRFGPCDPTLAAELGDQRHIDAVLDDRTFDLRFAPKEGYTAQVWGARILARPGPLPISSDVLDTVGLIWPGLSGPLNRQGARNLRYGDDTVYVRDEVLAVYEGKPDFEISPMSGGVSCGSQWSVGFIRRVGRDLLQLEARKLYEGAPTVVVRHWNNFAAPIPTESLTALRKIPNVATRARDLTDGLVAVGKQLVKLSKALGLDDLTVEVLTGLNPAERERNGWWNARFVEAITRHIPLGLSEPAFLRRCLDLDKVVNEGWGEAALRRIVKAMGPQTDTKGYGRLKLLDRLLCLAEIANETGLHLVEDKDEILERFKESGILHPQPIKRLFALSDLRQEAGHRKDGAIIPNALERCGLDPAATTSGWGTTLDGIYDGAIGDVRQAAAILERALAC
ncbi:MULTISPECIES: hypothetical protein [unclassified Sphingobium]|uniref:hypothetical protein n=1 Tax=unclassified Sphingobium TaxID=2611147 RepID=UPI000D16C259|nr:MULTISPECIES: hypothetical protein [unclassified Sphingobium]PSO10922.1 hypothetical protein C7E20_14380 [Sphingobium sp. AEW4]TWD04817.1 hypothetical protein FB595_11198 [Sphingobium sp. AEW010]TWD22225.1 hypothetical protein FB596_11198 [Sphingobium sp. AEW013]TWD24714.1 hypothetical protein FB594_11198 [Sphingobium sp. AEW001]